MANELSDIRLVIEVVANTAALDKTYAAMQKVNSATMVGQKMQANALKSVSAASSGWAKFSEKLAVTERKMDAVFRAGVHLTAMGRDLTNAGMGLFGAAGDIVSRYAKYDFILRQTSAALNTNEEWTRKLDKAIQNTAITLGKYKPEEVAEAYRLWGAATGDVVEDQKSLARITATVEKILTATAMTGGTVESNIKGIYGVLSQYNMKMSDAGHVTEVLALLTERTAANFGDLTGAFVYTGSAIGNIGGTFEDTAQVLGILADAGYRGTKAGRGLSMVFEAFLSPATEKARKALNKLAKTASGGRKNWEDLITPMKDGKRQFIGIRETVEKLALAMKNMGPVERQQAINAIFTNNAARAMLPTIQSQIKLWEQQAAAGKELTSVFDEYKYSLKEAGPFFANITDKMKNSIDGLVGAFQNSLFPIMQMVAVEIMKIAGPILKFLTGKLKELTSFLERNPALVEMVVKFGAIAAIILVVVGSFFTLLGTIALFMSNIFLVGAALMPLVGIVLAIIGAIVGLGVAFANNTKGIRDVANKLMVSIQRFFDIFTGGDKGRTKLITDITDALKNLATVALDTIIAAMDRLSDWLDSLSPEDIANIRELAINIGKVVAALLGFKAIIAVATTAFGIIKGAVMFLISPLLSLASGILAVHRGLTMIIAVLPLVGAAAGPIAWVIMGIIAAIAAFVVAYQTNFMGFKDFVDGIVQWFVNVFLPTLVGVFTGIWEAVRPILEALVGFFTDVVVPTFQTVVDFIVETFGPVFAQLGDTFTAIGEFFTAAVEAISGAVTRLQEMISEVFGAIGGDMKAAEEGTFNWVTAIVGLFQFVATVVSNLVGNWWNGMMSVIKTVAEAIATLIGGFLRIIEGIFQTITALMTGDWRKFWNGLHNIVGGFWDMLWGLIKGAFGIFETVIKTGLGVIDGIFKAIFGTGAGSIYSHITGFVQTLIKFGGDLIGGIVKGIGDAINGAIKSITGFFGNIIDSIAKELGIASPSTIMLGFGKNIVQGLWNGIVGLKDWIINKVTDFIGDIIPGPIKDALGIHSPSRLMAELGVNVVEGLAAGILKSASLATDAITSVTDSVAAAAASASTDVTMGGVSFSNSTTTDATRHIELSVDVTSGDGSVDQLDMNTLADLITGSSMVRALERMGATD